MRAAFLICSLWLLHCFTLSAQDEIPVGLVEMTQLTLTESPAIKSNLQSVKIAEGGLRVQRSSFDYHLQASSLVSRNYQNLFALDPRSDITEGKLNTQGMISSLGVTKRFRSGLGASLSGNYSSFNDNFTLNQFNQEVGPNINDHNFSSSLTLIQPLFRGRGRTLTTALERSAELDLQSVRSDMTFVNSVEIYETALSYWQYLTAYQSARIYEENEARVRQVLEITQELVEGDRKPRGDLAQVRADLANQERLKSLAQQRLIAARLDLGRAVGLSEEESQRIGQPVDNFPTVRESGIDAGLDIELLRDMARANRKDIEASRRSQQSLELQLAVASNNRKPQLDMLGTLNYGGVGMGNAWNNVWQPFTQRDGRNVGFEVGLSFDFPVNNNRAQGTHLQSKSLLRNQEITVDNLERNIDLNVSIAVNNIENTVVMLQKAEESFQYYQQAYSNEQEKFHNGLTTLLNLILFQERLTFAHLDYLQVRQQFANAIVTLRFETGTLVSEGGGDSASTDLQKELFYTIPNTK